MMLLCTRRRLTGLILSGLLSACQGSPAGMHNDVAMDQAIVDVPRNVMDTPTAPMDTPGAPMDTAVADMAVVDTATPPDSSDGYPAGPYGNRVGEVIPNLALQGYVNPGRTAVSTTLAFAPTSVGALRSTGLRYALIHTSGFLWGNCQNAARELAALTPELTAANAAVLEILVEGAGASVTRTELDAWINRPMLMLTATMDADPSGTAALRALSSRDLTFVVDLQTMRILHRYAFAGAADIRTALADLQRLAGM